MPAPPPPARRGRPDGPPPAAPTTDTLAALNAALDAVAAAEVHVTPTITDLANADRLDDLLALLGRFEDLVVMATDWRRRAANAAGEIVPSEREKYPVPGGGTFRLDTGAQKKHIDGPAVVAATAQAITDTLNLEAVVLPTGEAADPEPIIAQVVRTMVKVCGASGDNYKGWRVGALEELGVSLSKFTTWEDGPRKPVLEDRR